MVRARHRKKRGFLGRIITLSLLVVFLGYPFYEAYHVQLDEKTINISRSLSDLNNLKIVYLSDIHKGPMFSKARVESLVYKVNALNADIVLLGGDYADNSDEAIAFFQTMPRINARYVVAGVLGNHDRTMPESNLDKLQSAMVGAGVLPLVNNVKTIKIADSLLTLAGIDDPSNGHPDIAGVAAMTGGEDYVIFLSHSPSAIPQAMEATDRTGQSRWFDLALTGHTHGGQITFFGHPLISDFLKVPQRYLSGWIEENRIPILISNGIGTTFLPIRLFAPPQIHVITLRAVN